MDKIKITLITDTEASAAILSKRIVDHQFFAADCFRFDKNDFQKIISQKADVILIADDSKHISIEFAQKLYCAAAPLILLLSDNIDVQLLENAMQAGIKRVIDLKALDEEIIKLIKTAYNIEKNRKQEKAPRTWDSRVVSVFGAKGGIGKTTLSVNLAVALCEKSKKVALIDLGLQFGDVNMLLNINPKDTISELTTDKTNFTFDAVKSYMTLHYSGINVLCSPKSPEYAESVTSNQIEAIINCLRPYYDYIILDLPPMFNDVTISALENTNKIVFVTKPDISSLRNSRVCKNILDSLSQSDKMMLVLNQNEKGFITPKDIEKVLEMPICQTIANDSKTAVNCLNKGVPILLESPKSAISTDIKKLCAQVLSAAY